MGTLNTEIAIIGSGLAGLSCAQELLNNNHDILLIEKDPIIGGRLKTDSVDGFLLDHGFQVLQMAYPSAQQLLDYELLDVQSYPAGAVFRYNNRFQLLADPRRYPQYFLETTRSEIGSLRDRLRLVRLSLEVCRCSEEELFQYREVSARTFLEEYGFSNEMIDHFFVPFLTGICLDPEIRVSNRFLLYVLRMFSLGEVGVPGKGMAEIPRQLGEKIPKEKLLLEREVLSIAGGDIQLRDGGLIRAEAVVLATPEPVTCKLLGKHIETHSAREVCFYLSADEPVVKDPFLHLNGEGGGVLNSVVFPSMVAKMYAPEGKTLVAAVVPGHNGDDLNILYEQVRGELIAWFGKAAADWRLIETYVIEHALSRTEPPTRNPFTENTYFGNNIFVAGEYQSMPSIQWALHGGTQAAREVTQHLGGVKQRAED